MTGAEVFGLGIGGIGSVVDDTDVKRGRVEINDGGFGSGLIVGDLADSGEIRAGFHFDDGEVVLRIFVD